MSFDVGACPIVIHHSGPSATGEYVASAYDINEHGRRIAYGTGSTVAEAYDSLAKELRKRRGHLEWAIANCQRAAEEYR